MEAQNGGSSALLQRLSKSSPSRPSRSIERGPTTRNYIKNAESGDGDVYGRGIILQPGDLNLEEVDDDFADEHALEEGFDPALENAPLRYIVEFLSKRPVQILWYVGWISLGIFLFYHYVFPWALVGAWCVMCLPMIACIGFIDMTVKMRQGQPAFYRSAYLSYLIVWLLPFLTARSIYYSLSTDIFWVRLVSVDAWITCALCLEGSLYRLMVDSGHPRGIFQRVLLSVLLSHLVLVALYYAGFYLVDETSLDWAFYALPLAASAFLSHEISCEAIFHFNYPNQEE